MALTNIPIGLQPGAAIDFDSRNAVRGLIGMPRSITILGQKLEAAPGAVNERTLVTSNAQADGELGAGSPLAQMCKAALLKSQRVPVYYLAQQQAEGDAPNVWLMQFTIADQITPGTLVRYFGETSTASQMRVSIQVSADDTEASLAQKFVDAVSADPDLPVSAEINPNDNDSVFFVTKWAGKTAAQVSVTKSRFNEPDPNGVGVTLTETSAGSGAPSIADALVAIDDLHTTKLVCPYTDQPNMALLEAELADRWSHNDQKDGRAIIALDGTVADLIAYADDNRNSHQVVALGTQSNTPAYIRAAELAGLVEPAAAKDPAVAFTDLPFTTTVAPTDEQRHNRNDREALLTAGISTTTTDAGGVLRVQRLVTMYTQSANGALDPSYQDLNSLEGLSYWRWHQLNQIALQLTGFKRGVDGDDYGPQAGKIMTPGRMKAWLIGHYQLFVDAGLMTNLADYADTVFVEANQSDPNRLDTQQEPNLMNQLRFIATNAAFIR